MNGDGCFFLRKLTSAVFVGFKFGPRGLSSGTQVSLCRKKSEIHLDFRPHQEGIPVITAEPSGIDSYVQSCMQTKLTGQYNGK